MWRSRGRAYFSAPAGVSIQRTEAARAGTRGADLEGRQAEQGHQLVLATAVICANAHASADYWRMTGKCVEDFAWPAFGDGMMRTCLAQKKRSRAAGCGMG